MDLTGTYGAIPYDKRPLSQVTAFIGHHSDGRFPVSEADAIAAIQEIHNLHKHTRGWPGFAYNGAVWRRIYFRCRPANRIGYHSAGVDVDRDGIGDWNEKGYAVVLLGDYEHVQPPADMLETLLEAKALAEAEVGHTLQLRGHRSGWATSCPGNWWDAWSAAHGGV